MLKFAIIIFIAVSATTAPSHAQNFASADNAEISSIIEEGLCVMLLEQTKGRGKGKFAYSDAGVVQVMRDTQKGLLSLKAPQNTKIVSILCTRSVPIPSPLDYRVILSGYDLMTTSMGNNREFMTTLTKEDDAYVYTMEAGALTKSEQKIVDEQLEQFLEDEKEFLTDASAQ